MTEDNRSCGVAVRQSQVLTFEFDVGDGYRHRHTVDSLVVRTPGKEKPVQLRSNASLIEKL